MNRFDFFYELVVFDLAVFRHLYVLILLIRKNSSNATLVNALI